MKIIPLTLASILLLSSLSFSQQRELPPYPSRELSWKKGAAFADDFITDGATIRLIRDNGLTVAVFGRIEGDYLITEVAVVNETDHRVTVKPEDFFLVFWDKANKMGHVFSLPPAKVANKAMGRAKWGNFLRTFAAGMAQTTSTSNVSGVVNATGAGGSAYGTYGGTSTTTSPDHAAQRRAADANREATEAAHVAADKVLSDALWANTVFPKTYVSGLVYFERKKFEMSALYVVIDGTAYTFAFGASGK
jgi:hypothetical protein